MQNRTELIKITSLKKGNSATLYYSVPKKTTPSNKPRHICVQARRQYWVYFFWDGGLCLLFAA